MSNERHTSQVAVICMVAVFICVLMCSVFCAGGKEAVYKEAVKAGVAEHVVDADGNWDIRWIVK